MPTNPRILKAFRAMKAIGISEEKVKPVLKNLIKLYEKNWELIEQENYRALADAIFEQDEEEAVESKKSENGEVHVLQKAVLEEEAVDEEPERPLKRLRLRYLEGQASPSANNSGANSEGHSQGHQLNNGSAAADSQSTPLQTYARNNGKQPVSPNSAGRVEHDSSSRQKSLVLRKSPRVSSLKVPKTEPGIKPSPRHKISDTQVLIKPKDELHPLDLPQSELPLAVMQPEPSKNEGSSSDNASRRQPESAETVEAGLRSGRETNEDVPASSNGLATSHELPKAQNGCYSNLDIASSTFGEVKVSIDCDSALGRSNFHLPSLEAVLKLVEGKCLKPYKDLDPNLSVTKLMKDICECFLELGTRHNHASQETTNVDAENDIGCRSIALGSSNRSMNSELDVGGAQLEKPQLDPPCNDHNNCMETDQTAFVENSGNAPESDQNMLEHVTSRSPLAQSESAPDDTSSCLVTDITKGQEKVMISLVNEVNDKIPRAFRYIPRNAVFQNAYVNFPLARIGDDNSCSTCSGDCLSLSTPCACAYESGGNFAYTKEGLVKEELLKESISMNRDPKKHCQFFCKECPLERSKNEDIVEACKGHLVRNFIKECWWKCGCDIQCGNRVVQRGISRKLQVFMTPEGKGWGLRTLEDLPRGAFVCEYVGEVLTNAELFDRVSQSPNGEEHSYPVLLDADWGAEHVLKDEEALCLDATFYGNVARFINHRCYDSNMVEIPVEIETPDHHYYHLAFFTTRKVKAMEELTWDYGIDFDDVEHPVKAFKCNCGSKFCRLKRPRRARARRGW